MSGPLPLPPRSASVSDLLEAAVQLWRVTLLKCLPLAMIATICIQLANIYWLATGHTLDIRHIPADAAYRNLLVLGAVIYLTVIGALLTRQRCVAAGGEASVAAEINAVLRRLPVLLLTVLLAALCVALGLVALLVPGIFMAGCCVILLPIIMFEELGPVATLRRSVQLVRPLWWKAVAAMVIAWLVVIVCALVVAAILSVGSVLAGAQSSGFQAIATTVQLAVGAISAVFYSALSIVIYSAASSSA